MRPDPGIRALAHADLAHALHAGAQLDVAAVQSGFDPEQVLALLGLGHGDVLHLELQRLGGQTGQHQSPRLAGAHVTDVAVVDLEDDAIGVQRRHLEQQLAAFYRRTQKLAQVAGDDDAVERCDHLRARELFLHQGEL